MTTSSLDGKRRKKAGTIWKRREPTEHYSCTCLETQEDVHLEVLVTYINANIQRLILEHGDRLKVRRTFSWVRHRLDLLSQSFYATACITLALSRAERLEAVDVVLPTTYEKLAMRASHTHEGSAYIPQ
jgi:hypothetical protein